MTNDEMLHKWINGELTKEELTVFRQRPEYESLAALVRQTDGLSAPSLPQKEQILNQILQEKKAARVVSFPRWITYAVAASIVLLAVWFLLPNNPSNPVQFAATDQMLEGVLPDQSTFNLNKQSTLSYDEGKWEDERKLKLEGEAFFAVAKGKTFTVQTATGSVQVLGTKFNVKSRGEVLEVNCLEGKVSVLDTKGQQQALLEKGKGIRLVGQEATPKVVGSASTPSWTKGTFTFQDVPLGEILEEMERQFGIQFETGEIDLEEKLRTSFETKDRIKAFDKIFVGLLALTYEEVGPNTFRLFPKKENRPANEQP